MELVTAKTNIGRGALPEAEISKNKNILDKWIKEAGARLSDTGAIAKSIQLKAEDNFAVVGLPNKKTEDFKENFKKLSEDKLKKEPEVGNKICKKCFNCFLSFRKKSVINKRKSDTEKLEEKSFNKRKRLTEKEVII